MIRALPARSTLPLFVFRILADDPDDAFALDNLALIAHRLHGSSNLHLLLLSTVMQPRLSGLTPAVIGSVRNHPVP